ncbi:outer membrane protein transport protein [Phaeovulum vinaykumarii]|uniref:Long-chain fatty acid transport protein n=2 Tax=Phaeovulum vinaykumarii TaxID=407234 RepID=A0A1N7LHH4_9RHOB|nr:outer membrane protein transport protein [Phaeovulum vinaykumarii]SIS73267.1 Long-chain fatty acid transport protein [Phaeovulum vinaykumarii]
MKTSSYTTALGAVALTLSAAAAGAGGIDRSSQSVGILFEEGRYVELSMGGFAPEVSGSLGGAASGDMAGDWSSVSIAYKQAFGDKIDVALIFDQPIGADIDYPAGTPYPYSGSTATIDSNAITALMRYKLPSNFSIIGGMRALRTSGKVMLPPVVGYRMSTSTETDVGYIVGVAWEKPEIAARVALTYNSKITHDFDATETTLAPLPGLAAGTYNTAFSTNVPQSVNLEFQSGIAKDTLLFGSVRWVDWSDFVIRPTTYVGAINGLVTAGAIPAGTNRNLVDYNKSTITYTLGLGRKFNETWSGAVIASYEPQGNSPTGNLGPHDGMAALGVAATWKHENVKVTGMVRYVSIGDATTQQGARFSGNSGWGAGVRVGISF